MACNGLWPFRVSATFRGTKPTPRRAHFNLCVCLRTSECAHPLPPHPTVCISKAIQAFSGSLLCIRHRLRPQYTAPDLKELAIRRGDIYPTIYLSGKHGGCLPSPSPPSSLLPEPVSNCHRLSPHELFTCQGPRSYGLTWDPALVKLLPGNTDALATALHRTRDDDRHLIAMS